MHSYKLILLISNEKVKFVVEVDPLNRYKMMTDLNNSKIL